MITSYEQTNGYLTGQLLIAMPQMQDPRFLKSVIYICVHNQEGAMGLVVNKLVGSIGFKDLLQELNITSNINFSLPIYSGGPIEPNRGFVLHSTDYQETNTISINNNLALTATINVLRSIADGQGPQKRLITLGYAGWGPGQLDQEIHENGWLNLETDENILFEVNYEKKWEHAIQKIGANVGHLSSEIGHA
ncbi:MAG: YqgE/AlgH family protein [Alphaproteobacteria bacterium]|nr:YqgE/AlgH family protein [Alphaproteobacteria bacterium]